LDVLFGLDPVAHGCPPRGGVNGVNTPGWRRAFSPTISLSGLTALINGCFGGCFGARLPTLGPVKRSGTLRVHLLALGALCAVTFFIGLTTHGLTNWQEAQRALVAREMAQRGDW